MITYRRLTDKRQTGSAMVRMVDRFSGDLNNFYVGNDPLSKIPLPMFYEVVKNLPYKKDTEGVEIITRPLHLLTSPFKGYDCKKKAVLIAAWLKENNIPFQFIAVSSRQDGRAHHVLIRALINDRWVQIDPTYKKNRLFENKPWTNAEQLTGYSSGNAPVLVELYGEGNDTGQAITEFFNFRKEKFNDPLCLGQAETAVGTVIGIIAGIVASLATVAVVVVQAVQSRKEDERKAAALKASQAFQLKKIEAAADIRETELEQKKETEEKILKYGLIGGGLLAAFAFFK